MSDSPSPSSENSAGGADALLPALRAVDMYPVRQDGRNYFVLRDPMGYAPEPVVVPQMAALLLLFFDGKRTIRDLQTEFQRRYGQLILTEQIEDFRNKLDIAAMLDTPRFHAVRDEIDGAFRQSPVRQFCHAGEAYPDDPKAMRKQFDDYFSRVQVEVIPGNVRGIVAPHIDLRVSGPTYAKAYASLKAQPLPARFVVFGTAHQSPPNLFVLTRKAYATPLGPIPTDEEYIGFLERRLGNGVYQDEWSHRTEHSIEFQALFLKYLFPAEPGLRVVPVLCSSMHEWVTGGGSPGDSPRVSAFLSALRDADSELGPSVYIAGADLAHVGLKFGDPAAVDDAQLRWIESKDTRAMSHVERVDPEGFFRFIQEEKDQRRICGLSPIYALLKRLETEAGSGASGKLLAYDQAKEESTGSVVSFASAVIYRER